MLGNSITILLKNEERQAERMRGNNVHNFFVCTPPVRPKKKKPILQPDYTPKTLHYSNCCKNKVFIRSPWFDISLQTECARLDKFWVQTSLAPDLSSGVWNSTSRGGTLFTEAISKATISDTVVTGSTRQVARDLERRVQFRQRWWWNRWRPRYELREWLLLNVSCKKKHRRYPRPSKVTWMMEAGGTWRRAFHVCFFFLREWTSTVSEGRSLAMNHVRQRAGAAWFMRQFECCLR